MLRVPFRVPGAMITFVYYTGDRTLALLGELNVKL